MSLTVGDVLKIVATIAWTDGDLAQNVFNAVLTGSGGPFDEDDIQVYPNGSLIPLLTSRDGEVDEHGIGALRGLHVLSLEYITGFGHLIVEVQPALPSSAHNHLVDQGWGIILAGFDIYCMGVIS